MWDGRTKLARKAAILEFFKIFKDVYCSMKGYVRAKNEVYPHNRVGDIHAFHKRDRRTNSSLLPSECVQKQQRVNLCSLKVTKFSRKLLRTAVKIQILFHITFINISLYDQYLEAQLQKTLFNIIL